MIASYPKRESSVVWPGTSTTIALLALMKLKRVGRRTALQIVNRPITGNHDVCRDTLVELASRTHRHCIVTRELSDAWERSKEEINQCEELDIRALSFHDDDYPHRLRRMPDPPAILFVKGNIDGIHALKSLAVVGTREPTHWGREAARRCSRTAADSGFVIVSGLAQGCDTQAHEGCLDADGVGVAVLAHGLDKIYPAANRDLAERLLEKGGCLISEHTVEVRPSRQAFADRDRIQSGLADAVYVIETDVEGGTKHIVHSAYKQTRPIACLAHPKRLLFEAKTRGNQKYIRDGWAKPIRDTEALKEFLKSINSVIDSDIHPVEKEDTTEEQRALAF